MKEWQNVREEYNGGATVVPCTVSIIITVRETDRQSVARGRERELDRQTGRNWECMYVCTKWETEMGHDEWERESEWATTNRECCFLIDQSHACRGSGLCCLDSICQLPRDWRLISPLNNGTHLFTAWWIAGYLPPRHIHLISST